MGEYDCHIEDYPEINGTITVVPKSFEKLHLPTAAGDDHNQWNEDKNQKSGLGKGAFSIVNGYMQDWHGFFQNIPSDKPVSGIEVLASAQSTGMFDAGINMDLSWDSGNTYTSIGNTHVWSIFDNAVQRFGGQYDMWGREWDVSELEDSQFRMRLEKLGIRGGLQSTLMTLQFKFILKNKTDCKWGGFLHLYDSRHYEIGLFLFIDLCNLFYSGICIPLPKYSLT